MGRKSGKILQYVGIAATIIGKLISNWVADQKMEEIIEEKLNEALDRREREANKEEQL